MARRNASGAADGTDTDRPREPRRGPARDALGYTKPQTYEELRAVLSSGATHFSRRLRDVAIFLWQHPGDVALGTIGQVAEKAGVQPSTLVRFAQAFGYNGFSDLQEIFKEHIKGSWPEGRTGWPAATDSSRTDSDLHFLNGMIAASRNSLARIGAGFDIASFRTMVELLAGADLIHVVGSKRAFPVATYISLTLSQQGVRNVLVDNVGSTAFDQINCIAETDAVLAVSFSPYNSITPELVEAARGRKATVVSITDSALSPLSALSDARVEVIESDFAGFRSLAASLAVGMALVHGVASRRASG